jgi:outer membrane protein assembly factor BamA
MDLNNSNIFARYSYLENVLDYHISGFYTGALNFLNDVDVSPTSSQLTRSIYRFNNAGFDVQSHYAFDLFNRLEFGSRFMYLARTFSQSFGVGGPLDPVEPRRDLQRFAVVPQVAYVLDNTLGGWYGPSRGTRMRLQLSGSPKLHDDGLGFFDLQADIRQYFDLTDFLTLAVRGRGAFSGGENRLTYFMGGASNWINRTFDQGILPFEQPEDFAFMNFEFPMRGWDIAEASGSKLAMINAEIRTPLFYALAAGGIPLFLQAVQLNIFTDAGAAWDDNFSPNRYSLTGRVESDDFLMSSGLGIRTIALGLPLRLDVAWRREFQNWSQPVWLISLGGDW